MGDLLFVAVVIAFFAVTLAYIKGCERIVGPDTPPSDDVDAAHDDAVVTTARVGGPVSETTA
jgi:hypothetical protein